MKARRKVSTCWMAPSKASLPSSRWCGGHIQSHGLDDGLGGAHRVARLLARTGPHLQAHLAGGGLVVVDLERALMGGAAGPVGAKATGFDHQHMEAQRLDLSPEGLGQAHDGKLGGAILAQRRHAAEAGQGRDVDNAAAPMLAHAGQHGLDHAAEAEDVDLEHLSDLRLFAFFDGGEVAYAGVVDQHVDGTELRLSGLHRGSHLIGLGDVQLQHQHLVGGGVAVQAGGVACGDHRAVALLDGLLGQRQAKAGGTAGDEPDGWQGGQGGWGGMGGRVDNVHGGVWKRNGKGKAWRLGALGALGAWRSAVRLVTEIFRCAPASC